MAQAFILALIAGYSDALGFLSFNAFAGMMTGNAILLGVALFSTHPHDAVAYADIILSFAAGVALCTVLKRIKAPLAALLALEAAAIAAAALTPSAIAPNILACAMGIQNAAITHFAGVPLNTVFLTGDLQKLVTGIIARLWPSQEKLDDPTHGLAAGIVWTGYLSGVLLGGWAHHFLPQPLLFALLPLPLAYLLRLRSPSPA